MDASLSSDIYQYKVGKIFEDIPQCVGIADDIVIFSYDDHDHDATLYSVLDRAHDESKADGCQENGVGLDINLDVKSIIPTDLLPVAYCSKTLTDTESQYANIKHELLGVVVGVEKFHTFCYGWSTIVLSNYKPLASIVQKDWSMHPQG